MYGRRIPPLENWLSLAVISGAVFLTACSGALFKPGDWYETLEKPPWTPPNWVFPVGWTILYILIAYAGWRAWTAEVAVGAAFGAATGQTLAFVVFGGQLALNAAWSGIFFGLRRMRLALMECAALWILIALNIVLFLLIDQTAGLLLIPYLCWVTFAAALNAAVLARNPTYL